MLGVPGEGEHFVVYRDPLRGRVGCVLMQGSKVIAYTSWQLKPHEKNYLTHGLELAGGVCVKDLETLLVRSTL